MGGKNKVMRISQPSPTQIMLVQKQLENVGTLITSAANKYIQKEIFSPANWT
jgi:hypothetical protein